MVECFRGLDSICTADKAGLFQHLEEVLLAFQRLKMRRRRRPGLRVAAHDLPRSRARGRDAGLIRNGPAIPLRGMVTLRACLRAAQ